MDRASICILVVWNDGNIDVRTWWIGLVFVFWLYGMTGTLMLGHGESG